MIYTDSMHLFFTGFFFIFGSLLGSFSNVVILRMASGKSVIFPPSACPGCNHQLHAIDLIPVFSWLFLRGRCRYCSNPISWQYPLVEATISVIVGASFYRYAISPEFVVVAGRLVIWFICSVIFVRDEIRSPEPFLWAIIFYMFLGMPIGGCPFIDRRALLVPLLAVIIGLTATRKNNQQSACAWGCLSFITIVNLLPRLGFVTFWPLVAASMLSLSENNKAVARTGFFAIQLLAIAFNIAR